MQDRDSDWLFSKIVSLEGKSNKEDKAIFQQIFQTIDTDKTVVVFLIEKAGFWDILSQVYETSYKDIAIAAELCHLSSFCTPENFAGRYLYVENYVWIHSKLSHLNCLGSILGETV